VSTDGPVDLRLTDGTAERRKLSASSHGPGQVVIADPNAIVPDLPTPLANISQVNPPSPWSGSITAGALLIRGNTDSDSLNLGVNLVRTTTEDTLALNAAYLYGRTHDRTTGAVTTTADNWQIESRYDYNFTPRFYGFLDFLVRKDTVAFLDLRLVPSGGLGYKFVHRPDFTVTGEAGLAWVYERYTNDTPTKEDVSARLAYHINKKFNDTVSAFHNLEYLQSVQRGGNFLLNTDVGLHAQMTKHFFAEAKVTLDYDHNPAKGALRDEVFYAVNLGYNL
jgi:putative salt-induced outer membrane protein YdiY